MRMRMWMVNPRRMCRKHLLGEHVEIHMLAGSLVRGRSIDGFLAKGLLAPSAMQTRHAQLVAEMLRRGYRHASPLETAGLQLPAGKVDRRVSIADLMARCSLCAANF